MAGNERSVRCAVAMIVSRVRSNVGQMTHGPDRSARNQQIVLELKWHGRAHKIVQEGNRSEAG